MPYRICLAFLMGLAGCGSTIGALDSLPSGPDVSEAAWPRLVDTPEPPEERLTSGAGKSAATRMSERRAQSNVRLARASAVPAVSDTLLERGETSQSRTTDTSVPAVNEADLLARAELIQQRTQTAAAAVNETDLLNRANEIQARTRMPAPIFASNSTADPVGPRAPVPLRPLDSPVVSSSFEERARLAQQRAKRSGL